MIPSVWELWQAVQSDITPHLLTGLTFAHLVLHFKVGSRKAKETFPLRYRRPSLRSQKSFAILTIRALKSTRAGQVVIDELAWLRLAQLDQRLSIQKVSPVSFSRFVALLSEFLSQFESSTRHIVRDNNNGCPDQLPDAVQDELMTSLSRAFLMTVRLTLCVAAVIAPLTASTSAARAQTPKPTAPPSEQSPVFRSPKPHRDFVALPRRRVIVTTDGEIDDCCSMIRFLLYSNEFDTEGPIYTSSKFHWLGHTWSGVEWIHAQIEMYSRIYYFDRDLA